MGIRFRLRGLAETFIDRITCPNCGVTGHDDSQFSTELTKVTFDGIVAVLQCRSCREIFVPETQRLGIVDCERLREAVQQDVQDGDNLDERSLVGIRLIVERMNAERRGGVH